MKCWWGNCYANDDFDNKESEKKTYIREHILGKKEKKKLGTKGRERKKRKKRRKNKHNNKKKHKKQEKSERKNESGNEILKGQEEIKKMNKDGKWNERGLFFQP